jgi:flagellar motor switch/type III secretory pathway protein FliN
MAEAAQNNAVGGVRIVLGSRLVQAESLRRLSRGDVLELDCEPDGLVELHAGGRLMGRGVPVEIDGHFAVRLTEVFGVRG